MVHGQHETASARAELRDLPRQLRRDLADAALEILVTVVAAVAVISLCAVVGRVVGGTTGALVGGVVGVAAFAVLRLTLLAGALAWVVVRLSRHRTEAS